MRELGRDDRYQHILERVRRDWGDNSVSAVLAYLHEDQRLSPTVHPRIYDGKKKKEKKKTKLGMMSHDHISVLKKQRQVDAWDSLASQPALLSQLQATQRPSLTGACPLASTHIHMCKRHFELVM